MANIKVINYEESTNKLRDIYDNLIEKRGKLASVHTIQSLHPDSIIAHMELYMTIMFSQSPLSRIQREMIAVIVSKTNGCKYCQMHHGNALNNYWKNNERVQLLLDHYELANLNEQDILLCKYAIELTLHPIDFGNVNKVDSLKQFGFDDRAILDATLVVAYFNFVNRIVMALGVKPEADQGEGYKY